MADLSLFGSYTHSKLILIWVLYLKHSGLILIAFGSYTYSRLILIKILYLSDFSYVVLSLYMYLYLSQAYTYFDLP